VPAPGRDSGYAVEEFARRHGDYAICGVMAVAQRLSGDGVTVRVVHFGIGDVPVRSELGLLDDVTAPALTELIRDALADVEWAADLHATARYRRHLAEVLGARAAARACARALGETG
jgi:2-furoyl-CoA dehydrogenase FAD binding subunit